MTPNSHRTCRPHHIDYSRSPTGTVAVCNPDRGGCGIRWTRNDYGQTSITDRYGRPIARSLRDGAR